MKTNGLKSGELLIAESAIRDIIRYYTREAGVRSLEREISKICRKVVKQLLLKKQDKRVQVTARNLDKFLGVRRYVRRGRKRESGGAGDRPGVDRSRRRSADDRGCHDAGQGQRASHRIAG